MQDSFASSIPWKADHAKALAVFCSDGRFLAQHVQFLREGLRHSTCDVVAVPGGPACLAVTAPAAQAQVAREQVSSLLRLHEPTVAILIAHSDCGYYKLRLGAEASAERIRQDQVEDLHSARHALQSWFPDLAVELYYAQHEESRVTFTTVE